MRSPGSSAFAEAYRHYQAGRLREAHQACLQALMVEPNHIDALHLIGFIALQTGQAQAAANAVSRAIAINNRVPDLHNTLGEALRALGRIDEAIACYQRALALAPGSAAAHGSLGNALMQQGKFAEAVAAYGRALALAPADAGLHYNLGNALAELHRLDEAVAVFRRAIALNPNYAEAHNNLGNALRARGERDAASAAYRQALALRPGFAVAHRNLGLLLLEEGRIDNAIAAFERAVAADPDVAEAHNDLGSARRGAGHRDAALAAYDRALALRPNDPGALANRGELLRELGRYEESARDFKRLLSLDSGYDYAVGGLLNAMISCCDWRDYDRLHARLVDDVTAGKRAAEPFLLFYLSDAPSAQLACARTFAQYRGFSAIASAPRGAHGPGDKIRLAYLSADFHDHPVGQLMTGLIEAHDHSRFETVAVALGPRTGDETQRRLRAAFDRFLGVSGQSDEAVVRLLRELGIDIAVDLTGYTQGLRTGILAARAAPVQASYLGFPGTTGLAAIDYLIADRFVVPPERQAAYSEKLAYLPGCFFPNDVRRRHTGPAMTRAEAGLPDSGFVFCAFNNNAKITPHVFDVWMRLLREIEGSVLWLRSDRAAVDNLHREAKARGVDGHRLVFAPRVPFDDHIARLPVAGLFLDTFPYNAHTTASEALWAGLPVLTLAGAGFASRVAGSLLDALGIPELITASLAEYEALALQLARDPAALGALTVKLARNRDSSALFDTTRLCRHLESAYETMHARARRGEPPASFAVAALD